MNRILISLILFAFLLTGCSSVSNNASMPSEITPENENMLMGVWTADLNPDSDYFPVLQSRELSVHFSVRYYLPSPVITINSWNPSDQIIDVDVQIFNNNFLHVDGYDLRLIIYSDTYGHELVNADNYTGLFDIPGGSSINPFIAYAKEIPNRKFEYLFGYSENLQIKCPSANFFIQFAIEASYPGNCVEPYEIGHFTQDGILYDFTGSICDLSIDVLDWQNDVNSVNLLCPEITGTQSVPFFFDSGNRWTLQLTNNAGAAGGTYDAVIEAKSSGSGTLALYDIVPITVTQTVENGFTFPVGWPDARGYTVYASDGQCWMHYFPGLGYHLGEDWTLPDDPNADCGEPVYAVADGVVVYAEDYYGIWGKTVIIQHDNVDGTGQVISYHSHLTDMYVNLNDTVSNGEIIGTIGDNYGAYNCHLHFEIRLGTNTSIGAAFSPSIVEEGPYGQINPTEFILEHFGL